MIIGNEGNESTDAETETQHQAGLSSFTKS